jgi:hypothetical protein
MPGFDTFKLTMELNMVISLTAIGDKSSGYIFSSFSPYDKIE